jgi:DNA-binding beta-propeller fold protein YncE
MTHPSSILHPLSSYLRLSAFICGSILLIGCSDPKQPDHIWLETGVGPGQTVYPRCITYSKRDDCFFIADRMARIQRLDSHGKFICEWRMPDFANGKPVGLSVGPDGNLYVPDTHYCRVIVYSPTGQEIRRWGSFGKGPGQFTFPTDIAFDKQGSIYVSEYGSNDRVQVFDPTDLHVIRTFGKFGNLDGEFARPQSMVIDGDDLYITDSCNHRIVVFKTDGTFVRNMCSVGTGLGQLKFPYGLDEDREGHLVVAEFGNNRVQVIDKATGAGIRTWGMAGREPGQLAYPWAVAVDKDDRMVIVDSGNNRLQVIR